MTEQMGKRVRSAVVHAAHGAGVRRAVIAGLANEYLSYFTTPQEYQRQHYEGGSTMYGHTAADVIRDGLVDLAGRLGSGRGSPTAYAYDPTNGVHPTAAPFSRGATRATSPAQPPRIDRRLGHPHFRWTGGARGFDRPLDRAFVTVQRRIGRGWRTADDDLGLRILWTVGSNGRYDAQWEPALNAPQARYRFLVTANRYRLASRPFTLWPSRSLGLHRLPAPSGRVTLELLNHPAVIERDLTYRPRVAAGDTLVVRVGTRRLRVRARRGRFTFAARAGTRVVVPTGAARDRYGNFNGRALSLIA
jgi:hypothetical protein